MSRLRDLTGVTLRANPAYELVVYDRLSELERATLASLVSSPDFYGILRPLREGLNVKSISREAALLWFTLRDPGPIPAYCRSLFGERFNETVAQLVFDEILEIEHEGGFVAGLAAHARIYDGCSTPPGEGVIASLSLAALQYAQRLDLDDSSKLTARIYFYNRLPISARLSHQFPSEEAVAGYLGLDSRGRPRSSEGGRWKAIDAPAGNEGWRIFHLRDADRSARRLNFKLYLSPRCEQLPEAFGAAVSVLSRRSVPRFKVGSDLAGILRPDKLVAYFETLEELKGAADEFLTRLRGMPAQGVPFTSEIGGDGLLSWGMDPPREMQVLEWQAQTSWRVWLAGRLAVALGAARTSPGPLLPWQFAIDRVRLEGIDPLTWTPRQSLWQGES